MNLSNIVGILQIIISTVLIMLVLVQGKGGGLSGTFGGSFTMYRSRRGVEKVVLFMTILFSGLLVVNSLILFNL